MKTVKPDERRKHARHSVGHLPVRFSSEMLDFEADAQLEGEAVDIGLGGVFIRSDFLEVPGTAVDLQLSLPQRPEPLKVRGRVAWIAERPPRGPGMGIAFSGSPLERAVLEHCIDGQ